MRDIWKQLFQFVQKNPDIEWTMIDSTIVRAHACSAGYGKDSQDQESLGRSRGGFSTKIHTLADALGNPLKFILTPGQRNDITQANHVCEHINNSPLIADKGYDCDAFTDNLQNQGCEPVIPSKKNRKQIREYDEHLYKERHAIECFFWKN